MKISGFWDSHLNVVDLRDNKEYEIVKKFPLPENAQK